MKSLAGVGEGRGYTLPQLSFFCGRWKFVLTDLKGTWGRGKILRSLCNNLIHVRLHCQFL